jgi:hypothetical protein
MRVDGCPKFQIIYLKFPTCSNLNLAPHNLEVNILISCPPKSPAISLDLSLLLTFKFQKTSSSQLVTWNLGVLPATLETFQGQTVKALLYFLSNQLIVQSFIKLSKQVPDKAYFCPWNILKLQHPQNFRSTAVTEKDMSECQILLIIIWYTPFCINPSLSISV